MVIGEDLVMIFNLMFSSEARKNYVNPDEDFSERSIVQLRNKLKADADIITKRIKNRKPEENSGWFFKKYKLTMAPMDDEKSSEVSSDEEEEDYNYSMVDSKAS
mmetsp:Transcript_23114/g.35817  ORF Transcript_23114/g.35817 Transcript_23114/m.35817 type:complete len:104 (-) Transcript_23114:52-363(-)